MATARTTRAYEQTRDNIAAGRERQLKAPCQQRDELLAALIGVDMFFRRPDEDANDAFERVAIVFQNETGYLRPGKDCVLHDPKVRQQVWDNWVAVKLAASRAAIAKATAP